MSDLTPIMSKLTYNPNVNTSVQIRRKNPPTNEEIEAVMGLTVTSSQQLYDRLRDLFAGVDYFSIPRTNLPRTLEEYQEECYQINVDHGWFDSERSFGDDVALLHTEVSEMYEAYRKWELEDATAPMVNGDELPKPEGVGSEVADVQIRLFDTCQRAGINLRAEMERKIAFNKTRPYMHGNKKV